MKELVEVQIVRIPAVSTNKRAYSPAHGGEWGFQFYRNDWENVSEDAKDFIRALLVPDPLQRATAKKVGELERHESRLARCDGCSLSQHERCT